MSELDRVGPWLVAGGWAALVMAWAMRRRPPSRRLRRLLVDRRVDQRADQRVDPGGPSCGEGPARRGGPINSLGRLSEGLGRRAYGLVNRPAPPERARRLGRTILAGAGVAPIGWAAAVSLAAVVWALPAMAARRAERRRFGAVEADLPDVVDLLSLAVGAGLTVHLALEGVARRATGPVAAELAQVCREVRVGRRLADALDSVPHRAGEVTRPLVAALVASDRYGAPLAAGLERLSIEVRTARRRAAEEAARKVPVKLLFPLVVCSLPAFALLTVAPLIASGVRSLPL